MKQLKIKHLLLAVLIITSITGCGTTNTDYKSAEVELTEQSREVNIQNKSDYTQAILDLITSGNSDSTVVVCSISSEDIEQNAIIEQIYWFNGSIYAQVNNKYMYRFQLSSDNLIESYIKYELEA